MSSSFQTLGHVAFFASTCAITIPIKSLQFSCMSYAPSVPVLFIHIKIMSKTWSTSQAHIFAFRLLGESLLRIISVTPLKVDGHPMCITELSVWWSASEWYATLSGGLLQRVLRPPVKFMPPDGNLAMPPLPVTLDLKLQQCSVMS